MTDTTDTSPQRISNRPARLSQFLTPVDPAPWRTIARAEDGVTEALGPKDNARVQEYQASVVGKMRPWLLRDSIAWCAAFVGWCLVQAGYRNTGSMLAKSYETYGIACELRIGCIVVLKRGLLPWQRHVAICEGWDDKRVHVRGGNQGNRVCLQWRPRKKITATRWPLESDRLPAAA